MRNILITIMLACPALGLISAAICGLEMRAFLARTLRIENIQDMERLKRLVAWQMYFALAQFPILGLPPIAFMLGFVTHQLGILHIAYIVLPSLVVIAVSLGAIKPLETRVKALPVDDAFYAEFQNVVDTWMNKPFPDW